MGAGATRRIDIPGCSDAGRLNPKGTRKTGRAVGLFLAPY